MYEYFKYGMCSLDKLIVRNVNAQTAIMQKQPKRAQ